MVSVPSAAMVKYAGLLMKDSITLKTQTDKLSSGSTFSVRLD
jgi:hypothetical protein